MIGKIIIILILISGLVFAQTPPAPSPEPNYSTIDGEEVYVPVKIVTNFEYFMLSFNKFDEVGF